MLKQLEARGASVTDREAVISSLGQAWRNLPYFVGAYGVAFVPDLLGYIGTGIAAIFVAMLAVFIAQDIFALGVGFSLLVAYPFAKGQGIPSPLWVALGCLINLVQGAIYAGLAWYVGYAAGWWGTV